MAEPVRKVLKYSTIEAYFKTKEDRDEFAKTITKWPTYKSQSHLQWEQDAPFVLEWTELPKTGNA